MGLFALISVVISAITSVTLALRSLELQKLQQMRGRPQQLAQTYLETFLNVLISTFGYGTIGMILGLVLRSPISAIRLSWLVVGGGVNTFDCLEPFR